MSEDEYRALIAEFKAHAKACAGCGTSLALGTWFGYRCEDGERIGRRLVGFTMRKKEQ